MKTFLLIASLLAADPASEMEYGTCVDLTAGISEMLGQSVEGIGGYCPINGKCTLQTLTVGAGGVVFSSTCSLTYSAGVVTMTNCSLAVGGAGQVIQSQGNGMTAFNTSAGGMTSTLGYRAVGVATGSLPACGAGNAGTLQYNTSSNNLVLCDGTNFVNAGRGHYSLSGVANNAAVHGAYDVASIPLNHYVPVGTAVNLGTVVTTAGATGGTYTFGIWDASQSAWLAQSSTISCTQAAQTVGTSTVTSALGSTVAGDQYRLRVDFTSCTGTDPILNVTAAF